MVVLGIETSCDETAASIIDCKERKILSNIVISQIKEHSAFGGVVPEIAARAHTQLLPKVIDMAIKEAIDEKSKSKSSNNNFQMEQIDLIAATCGPGLIGGVMAGATYAKALSLALNKPFVAVNHLAGHALMPRLIYDIPFPYLLLLVSGGHTQILLAKSINDFQLLGTTLDDAVGEAFDKSAKIMNLPYPGGPEIEKLATFGDKKAFILPQPLVHKKNSMDFSFSGLKTAVKKIVADNNINERKFVCDMSASLQDTIGIILSKKIQTAITHVKNTLNIDLSKLVISGGVAANKSIRTTLQSICKDNNMELFCPPIHLCTDNGAMIAWAGFEKFSESGPSDINFEPKARWPL